ncbi:MAG: ATP-binding cassette domain-containing protein [Pseudomonadota bacterium]
MASEAANDDHIIEVRGLINQFGTNRVHDELDLTVNHGEVMGLIGGSGTGKSVLFRSILGLHKPNAGRITVLGREIQFRRPGPEKDWGVLFQSGALLSGLTVQQNVELPIALHSEMSSASRAELAVLKIRMTGLPVQAAGKYPSELSGGMVKRAALARALALEPKLLFLDEPTSGLDPVAATEFDQLIDYLKRSLDLTVVMITHDLDSVFGICDRIAVLVDRKTVTGPPTEIAQIDHPWIQRYFGDTRAQRAMNASDPHDR